MKTELTMLIEDLKQSSFNRPSEKITFNLNKKTRFIKSLLLWTDYDNIENNNISFDDFFKKATPGFQRDNNKWSLEMKIKFVENILKGISTTIILFKTEESEDAQIMDGLQRLTAIADFMDDKFKVFGFYFSEIEENIRLFRTNLTINLVILSRWEEIGKYYIDMNENITHSKEDIQKAKDWFKINNNITL